MKAPRTSLPDMGRREKRIVAGFARGVVAAMAMTGARQLTTGLGLVDQTPPDAIFKQRAAGPLVRSPRLAYFVARREVAVIELAHWLYGAGGGAAFTLLPREVHRSVWAGPGYGLATWLAFELSIAPLLGLDQARRIRVAERLMFAADHLLYGVILAGDRRWASRGSALDAVVDLRGKLERVRPAGLGGRGSDLRVEQAMTTDMVVVTPEDTVGGAAVRMADGELAAAIVESAEPGILTARDVLEFVGAGRDPDAERVGDHATEHARSTSPHSSLDDAASAMVDGGFRHLVVTDAGRTVGLLAMRDLVRCWVEARAFPQAATPIREAMNTDFLTLGVDDSIQGSALAMSERGSAAAVVEPSAGRPYPGIFTEREVLHSLRAGRGAASERLADHLASSMTFSAPGWSLKQAAEAMTKGGFQHIVVVDPHETRGVISMRDIVRRWTSETG